MHVPQAKNGEQPAHSFDVLAEPACSVLVRNDEVHTSSAQQGLTVSSNTYKHPNNKVSLMR